MRLLKLASCFLVVLFLSCESDNFIYFVEGKVKASEQQKTSNITTVLNQKYFSFDLNNSKDFKVYINELSELSILNFKIKSNIDFKRGNYILTIDNNQYQLKNSLVVKNNLIEISDSNLLSIISDKLLKNKKFNFLIKGPNLNREISSYCEMTLDLKGTFFGVH